MVAAGNIQRTRAGYNAANSQGAFGFSFSSIQSKSTMSSLRMKKLRMKRNKTQIDKSMENKVEDTEVIHFHLLNCAAINFLTGRAQTESN